MNIYLVIFVTDSHPRSALSFLSYYLYITYDIIIDNNNIFFF